MFDITYLHKGFGYLVLKPNIHMVYIYRVSQRTDEVRAILLAYVNRLRQNDARPLIRE